MSTPTLPVPITFKLPEGMAGRGTDAAGALARRSSQFRNPDSGSANITIDGEYCPDTATLAQIAEESERSGCAVTDVHVVDQGGRLARLPGPTQTLRSALAGGVSRAGPVAGTWRCWTRPTRRSGR
ncbi:hypothetical protein [Streptomyces sp. KL116D]|uniref:hypothetical protein n=1 Tax=Streptomyces sp. KL116D TaxID=3045152 RepID=UPI003557F047